MNIEPPREEYRYLHTSLQLRLSLWDRCKLALGWAVFMGACFRIVLEKTEEGQVRDVSVDMYSTKAIVAEDRESVPTSDAIFDYKALHKTK